MDLASLAEETSVLIESRDSSMDEASVPNDSSIVENENETETKSAFLLSSVVAFLSGKHDGEETHLSNLSRTKNMTLEDFVSKVPPLLHFLEKQSTKYGESQDNEWFSAQDISELVLPPAIKQLLHLANISKKEKEFFINSQVQLPLWSTVSSSINHVMPTESKFSHQSITVDFSIVGKTLTHGALNKLIPYAIKVIFHILPNSSAGTSELDQGQKNETNQTENVASTDGMDVANASAQALIKMLRFFRPNNALDVLVRTLQTLVQLATAVSISNTTLEIIGDLYSGFLEVIDDIIDFQLNQPGAGGSSSSSTHKTVFSRIANNEMIISLSAILAHANLSKGSLETSYAKKIETLLRSIFVNSLFHPEIQIAGFQKVVHDNKYSPKKKEKVINAEKPVNNLQVSNHQTENEHRSDIYQQKLFEVLDSVLNENNDSSKQIHVLKAIPLFFECFIEQSFFWQNCMRFDSTIQSGEADRKARKRRRKIRDSKTIEINGNLTKLQFQFWRLLMNPVFKLVHQSSSNPLTDEIISVALQALFNTLANVKRHSIYLPVYDEEEKHSLESRKATLRTLADNLLDRAIERFAQDFKVDDIHRVAFCEYIAEQARVLSILVSLNHLLFHSRLRELIFVASTSYLVLQKGLTNEENRNFSNTLASELLVSIINIYGKLRQVDYIFSSMLDSQSSISDKQEENSGHHAMKICDSVFFSALTHILKDELVSCSLSKMIFECPQGQIQSLWKSCSEFICDNESKGISQGVELGVSLFVLLAESIKIDSHSADNIMQLCVNSTSVCVSRLVGEKPILILPQSTAKPEDLSTLTVESNGFDLRLGLQLHCSFVDLHTRCCFWSSSLHSEHYADKFSLVKTTQSDEIFTLLNQIIQAVTRSADFVEVAENTVGTLTYCGRTERLCLSIAHLLPEMYKLAFQRMKQLHSEVFRREQIEYDDHEGLAISDQLQKEMEGLVHFAFYIVYDLDCPDLVLQKEIGSSFAASASIQLSRTVSLWSNYAKEADVEAFLRWILISVVDFHNKNSVSYSLRKESGVAAKSLLQDTYFLEKPIVRNTIPVVAASLILITIETALFTDNPVEVDYTSILSKKAETITDGRAIFDLESFRSLFYPDIYSVKEECSVKLRSKLKDCTIATRTQNLGFAFRMAKLLEISVARQSFEINGKAFDLLALLHELLTISVLSTNDKYFFFPMLVNLLGVSSCVLAETIDEGELSRSFCVVERVAIACMASFLIDEIRQYTHNLFNVCLRVAVTRTIQVDGVNLAWRMLNWLSSLLENSTFGRIDQAKDLVQSSLKTLGLFFRTKKRDEIQFFLSDNDHLVSSIEKVIEKFLCKITDDQGMVPDESMFMVGEVIYISGLLSTYINLEQKCFLPILSGDLIQTMENPSTLNQNELIFMCAICCGPSDGQTLKTAEALSALYDYHASKTSKEADQLALFDPAICHILRVTSAEELLSCLDAKLNQRGNGLRGDKRHETSAVHFMNLYLKVGDLTQKKITLGPIFDQIYEISYHVLESCERTNDCHHDDDVLLVLDFLSMIWGGKTFIWLSKLKLSVLMSFVAKIFTSEKRDSLANSGLRSTSLKVFTASCSLMATILRGKSSLLKDCAVNFFAILRLLVADVFISLRENKEAFKSKILDFERLCEFLPEHKHFLGRNVVDLLVHISRSLYFIDTDSMSALLRSIFFLLDSCSPFDIALMNTLMESDHKILFRSVFQDYKKRHQYKGNF